MSMTSVPTAKSSGSHETTRERFSRDWFAEKYPTEYGNSRRDRREKECILECLKTIPAGSKVLDLPCGTGRMTRLLVERGFSVTGVDISEAMLNRARDNYRSYQKSHGSKAPPVHFQISDVMQTGFADNEFGGVACIRLFHHFSEAGTRRQALAELRRICRGPIVVTFLNSFALDRVSYWVRAVMKGKKQVSQLPIPLKTFAADIDAAGLKIDKEVAAHWGISNRWFLVLSRKAA